MSVLMIMELKAKSEAMEQLRTYLNAAETRAFAGNEGVEVAMGEGSVLVLAHWATRQDYDAYLAWRTESGEDALFELLDGGRDGFSVRAFDVVDRPRARRSKTRDEALEDLEEWSKRWLSLRAQIRELADAKLSAEHLGPVIKLHNEELDSIMAELASAGE